MQILLVCVLLLLPPSLSLSPTALYYEDYAKIFQNNYNKNGTSCKAVYMFVS
jgi:hypothetical protein